MEPELKDWENSQSVHIAKQSCVLTIQSRFTKEPFTKEITGMQFMDPSQQARNGGGSSREDLYGTLK